MATIAARKTKKGTSYQAKIRINSVGAGVYTESKSFPKRAMAVAWAAAREVELALPGQLDKMRTQGLSCKQVLSMYLEDFNGATKFGRSKLSHINFLMGHSGMAELDAVHLRASQLMSFARTRHAGGTGPSTINNDFIWLRNAFKFVGAMHDLPLATAEIDKAVLLCREAGLIARSGRRERRPEIKELNLLLEHFAAAPKSEYPMVDIILFAIFSSRRQEEICSIRWDDLQVEAKKVLVREMKHPTQKVDTWVFLPDRALEIIARQPRIDERIFPYGGKTAGTYFGRATKVLGIEDLRFHDLRHEAASHLFETGLQIHEVAGVTGHRSWATLQRYTHLTDFGVKDKYEAWRWLGGCR